MTQEAARPGRVWRWAVALLVTVSMLLASAGVAVFAQTGSGGGPAFLPASAVGYAEVRLDLPGDQHDQLAAFLAHFPGFADPSTFDTKMAELLDQLVSEASDGQATWSANIQPWFSGQLSLGVLGITVPAEGGDDDPEPQLVVALGVTDRAALETQVASLSGSTTPTTEEYAGSTISSVGDLAWAITDQYLLLSPQVADLKVSLDVLAGTTPSLNADPAFSEAAAALPADNLVEFYFATAALKTLLAGELGGQPGTEAVMAALDNLPEWVIGSAVAASDHLAIQADVKLAAGGVVPSVRESDIATKFPAGTLLYLEARDLGATLDAFLGQLKTQLATDPEMAQQLAGIERIFGTPLEDAFDFLQDAGIGVSFDGSQVSFGLVGTLSDEGEGGRRIQAILGILQMLGNAEDSPMQLSQADVNGIVVTTITINDPAGLQAFDMPITPSLSIGVGGGHLYLGLGEFAATAIAQDPATSLATDPRFSAGMAAAGVPNAGSVWLDFAGVAPVLEGMMDEDDRAQYETEIKPWVDALDYFVASITVNGDVGTTKAQLYVK